MGAEVVEIVEVAEAASFLLEEGRDDCAFGQAAARVLSDLEVAPERPDVADQQVVGAHRRHLEVDLGQILAGGVEGLEVGRVVAVDFGVWGEVVSLGTSIA